MSSLISWLPMTGYQRKSVADHTVYAGLGLRQIGKVTDDHHELRRRHVGRGAIDPVPDLLQVIFDICLAAAGVQVTDNDKGKSLDDLKAGIVRAPLQEH